MMNRLHTLHRLAGLALMLGLLTLANPAAAEDIRRFCHPRA
jgi:hypothetical protein